MSVTIEQVTIDTIDDNRLVLGNAQWAAKLNILDDWTRLRIGFRYAFSDLTVNPTGSPRLYCGVMSAPTSGLLNGPLGATTSHFCGIRTNASSWTRVDSTSDYYLKSTNSAYGKKVNDTFTTTTGAGTNHYSSYKPDTNRNAIMLDIEKLSSISTQINCSWPTDNSNDTGDVSEEILRTCMEVDSITGAETLLDSLAGVNNFGAVNNATIATDEVADGLWDSIVIAWDRTNPLLYVSEMFFAKLE